jgi:hypothetical protein
LDDQIYFQWQNNILRQTIYPLREMKLRDFLVFYEEIDIWQQYQHKTEADADIQAEIETYKQAQVSRWLGALAQYVKTRDYLTSVVSEAVWRQRYPLIEPDADELAQINKIHSIFTIWLPKVTNPRSENYFISQRVYEWETHRKTLTFQISECQRKMRNYEAFMGPNDPHRDRYSELDAEQGALLEKLQTRTLKMADAEMDLLYGFLSISGGLEARRAELAAERAQAQKIKTDATALIAILQARLAPIVIREAALASDLARLRNPPDRPALDQYFLGAGPVPLPTIAGAVALAALARDLQFAHSAVQQGIRSGRPDSSLALAAQNASWVLSQARSAAQHRILELESNLRNMPANWSHRAERQAEHDALLSGLTELEPEIGHLADFVAALANASRTPAQTAALIEQKEAEDASVQASINQLRSQIQAQQDKVAAQAPILDRSDEDRLAEFSPTEVVTVRDIAKGKADDYRASLTGKDQAELLELVAERFLKEPDRYPLWLQYMVIHFSGMRYASAHGSWADPRELLMNLRTPPIAADFKALDQAAIDALCNDKISSYGATPGEDKPGPPQELPALSQTTDATWKAKIGIHLRNMQSLSPYYRTKGLFDLLLDEETYNVEQMTDDEVTEALQLLRVSRPIPDWMWREIVAHVPSLRLTDVTDPDWEHLTPQEQAEKNLAASAADRAMINLWEQDNLTGWREEHAATDQLIVSRAVCNEVAEHIQHLRGNIPGGGLTAKPQWYLSKVSEAVRNGHASDPDAPYLLRGTVANAREGASILYLQFVPDFPNEWRIAHPTRLSDGQDLLPPELFTSGGGGGSHYQLDSGTVKRTGVVSDASGARVSQVQWLRWIHEATIVQVTETAEGTVVLTFETALPYEDKRLSTIGVFKHDPSYVTFSIGTSTLVGAVAGYAPPGEIPYKNLEPMLDWNKILLRQALSDAELAEWRGKYLSPA